MDDRPRSRSRRHQTGRSLQTQAFDPPHSAAKAQVVSTRLGTGAEQKPVGPQEDPKAIFEPVAMAGTGAREDLADDGCPPSCHVRSRTRRQPDVVLAFAQ